MSFRRIPFQFSSTDPAERQAELEKRFGLPSSNNNMYVDVANPLLMGAGNKDSNLSSGSPRLQHRVPIFVEGRDQPIKSSVDSATSEVKRKPSVRTVPIEVEASDSRSSSRQRTFSGPAGWARGNNFVSEREDSSPLKRSMQDLSKSSRMKAANGPVVHHIPVKLEDESVTVPTKVEKTSKLSSVKKDHSKVNGCAVSMELDKVVSPDKVQKAELEKAQKAESPVETSLKKIQNILEELKLYESGVQEFSGTVKDKQYRYFDEMLTRCMLRLDDIDTMGNSEIRSARKNAVKKVEACVDQLEMKVNVNNKVSSDVDEQQNISKMQVDNQEINNRMKEADTEEISAENKTTSKVSSDIDEQKNISAIQVDSQKMNSEIKETEIKRINTENTPGKVVQEQASEVEMLERKDIKCEIEKCNDLSTITVASNNISDVTANEKEVVQSSVMKDSDVQDINMVEVTNIKTDEDDKAQVNKIEIEITEADELSKNFENVNEVEMTESKQSPSGSMHPEGASTNVTSLNVSEESVGNFKDTVISPESVDIENNDIDMKEIQGVQVMCESIVDPAIKDIINERVAQVSSEIDNSNL